MDGALAEFLPATEPADVSDRVRQRERAVLGLRQELHYGSGALWSSRLAAMLFSLFATLDLAKINIRLWLTWYLQSCAENGGQVPSEINQFLPWNLSPEQRRALTIDSVDSS